MHTHLHSALQRDITLGQSPRHSPLPCIVGPTQLILPAPFKWTDALVLPPGLSGGSRALVEEGCDCGAADISIDGDGGGCCSSASTCPCASRARRDAAAAAGAGAAAGGGGSEGDGVVEVVLPFECAGPRCSCPPTRCRLRATQVDRYS